MPAGVEGALRVERGSRMFVRKKRAPARKAKAGKKRAKGEAEGRPASARRAGAAAPRPDRPLPGRLRRLSGLRPLLRLGRRQGRLRGRNRARLSVRHGRRADLHGPDAADRGHAADRHLGLGPGPRDRPRRGACAASSSAATRRRATVARTHADWREQRKTRSEAETWPAPTDVMSSYPETDEFEPTVQLAEEPEDEPDLALAAERLRSRTERRPPSRAEEDANYARRRSPWSREHRPRPLTPHGQQARRHDLGGDRLPAAAGEIPGTGQRRQGPRPARPGSGRPQAGRDPRPLRGRGEDRRRRQRSPRLPLRTAPGARASR